MRNLQDVLTGNFGLDLSGWVLSRALGISDDGLTIVGVGIDSGGHEQGWAVTVPEPATVVLLQLGALVFFKRRRQRG